MNFFKSGFQSVLGTAETAENVTGAETVCEIIEKSIYMKVFESVKTLFFTLFLGRAAGRSSPISDTPRGSSRCLPCAESVVQETPIGGGSASHALPNAGAGK